MPEASEFDFIDWIRSLQSSSPNLTIPIGDDLAALQWEKDDLLLVGVDQVLDGVHFDSMLHSPRSIGKKVMNRNLSDCAAMACLPVAAVATVALQRGTPLDYAKELYLGLCAAGDVFNTPVVGGDTASWAGKLALSVTIFGKSAGVQPIRRSGARPGDSIYVTGPLGGSILSRHMEFVPRIKEARQLALEYQITSMIDLSDGLSRDLRHICLQSKVGALIQAGAIPIHPDAIKLSNRTGRPFLEHALHDGEDYELLFTTPDQPRIGTRIGQITHDQEILLEAKGKAYPLQAHGWEHLIS
jgi:thiamine-monophosphate kinase